MQQFNVGDRVVFRESENGAPENGVVEEVIPADEQYPNGGLYIVRLEDGTAPEVFHVELTLEDKEV